MYAKHARHYTCKACHRQEEFSDNVTKVVFNLAFFQNYLIVVKQQ